MRGMADAGWKHEGSGRRTNKGGNNAAPPVVRNDYAVACGEVADKKRGW